MRNRRFRLEEGSYLINGKHIVVCYWCKGWNDMTNEKVGKTIKCQKCPAGVLVLVKPEHEYEFLYEEE